MGVYFAHYECLGHTSRVMAVAEVFNKRFPLGDLFFIQAGIPQPKAKIDTFGRVYALPGAFMDRRHFRERAQTAGLDTESRNQACLEIITRERPDLFITEFFPLGLEDCRHELIPSLAKASAQGTTLWGVAGYPLLTGTNHEWREKIFKLYKKIIIFSPLLEKDFIAGSFAAEGQRRDYLDVFQRHGPKIIFAGYFLPRQEVVRDDMDENLPKPPVPRGACRVAVLRGGGAYYPKLIAEAIRASDFLGKEYYWTVVAGPATTTQEWYFFSTLVGAKKIKNLILLKSVGNYEGLVENSDVCVSVASYHTSVMLLKHRKKAVLVPFEGPESKSFQEQPARAALLREMIGAEILSFQDLSVSALAAAVKSAASRKAITSDVPKEWFLGGDVLDKELIGLFGR
jgi:predicted glycosyltransferase